MNKQVFDIQPRLKTKRLVLRKLSNPNLDHLLEITSFNGRANTKEEVQTLLKEVESGFVEKSMLVWGMFYKDELIGTIGFYRGFKDDIGEVGYVTREAYRRKGFLNEAMTAILHLGFVQMDLRLITAYTTDMNEGSIGVLTKFGFHRTNEFAGEHRRYELSVPPNV